MDARNPWKGQRQAVKASLVADLIWAGLTVEEKLAPALPAEVAAMDADTRYGWACGAGVNELSEESWEKVVAAIEQKRASELRWRASA